MTSVVISQKEHQMYSQAGVTHKHQMYSQLGVTHMHPLAYMDFFVKLDKLGLKISR